MLIGVVGALLTFVAVYAWRRLSQPGWQLVGGPVVSILLIVVAVVCGLSTADLGLAHWLKGLLWGLALIVATGIVYAVVLAIPAARRRLREQPRRTRRQVLFKALVAVPSATVLLEEVAFRGVMYGALTKAWTPLAAVLVTAILFGLWHLRPENGPPNWAIVAFTALAGLLFGWLRYETGSLATPFLLHWATNGIGVLATAAAWHLDDREMS